MYLRETPLTEPDAALKEFAHDVTPDAKSDPLERLHSLLVGIHRAITFDTAATASATSAAEAFKLKRGVCQDLTHIFIACARHLDIPARYIGGYMLRTDVTQQEAGHAWAEALVEGLGWVGFDPANGICPTENHVRVAVGLDYLGAAPIRGTRQGGAEEQMHVAVQIGQAQSQWQS
jgi:transglutaminase-like putative cysteine protease